VVRSASDTRHSPETTIKEHHQHITLHHLKKSTIAKHSTNFGHHIQFNDTGILAKKSGHREHIIMEVKKIELHANNMNREEALYEQGGSLPELL